MPTQLPEIEEETRDAMIDDHDDDNRFSQEDDDIAGRSWHGMNSEIEPDEVGVLEEDLDGVEVLPRPGRIERV